MKDPSLKILAIKTIILSVFGLSTLPFFAVIVQFLDSKVSVSPGDGYYTNSMRYLLESPLIYIEIVLCINVALGIVYLIYRYNKAKQDDASK